MSSRWDYYFPVHSAKGWQPLNVPWDLVLPHEEQAKANHGGQSLLTLAARGGLSICELASVLDDQRYGQYVDSAVATERVLRAWYEWTSRRARCQVCQCNQARYVSGMCGVCDEQNGKTVRISDLNDKELAGFLARTKPEGPR